ncbi:Condensation domain-containing protein [Dyadobacter koreensis]|uniref:Phthiocerol/phthiodiolone dimycocerosyl transferase n=1 Tax=Dyadobacter koreensis TaxID=408657 RepID=A0A1H6QPE6_9BACT|nr:condensation domain-containing protein [Dyadobacter koreensis]SEI45443.1 Condensation domain-containing protein [Dyadobacter koreensis]
MKTTHQNRTLGAFEKTFWLLDQIDSKDFALAADISGTQPVEKWKNAISIAQRRHPNLSVKIVMDELSRPTLQHVENITIPLRVVDIQQDDYRWEQEVEKELSIRFDTKEGPLLRVVLVQKLSSTVLILVANHSVADGTSLNFLVRDILLAVNGKPLAELNPQVSNDQTLGLSEDLPAQTAETVPELKMKSDIVKPLVSSLRISENITRNITESARKENTTVHGALCAAVLLASRKMRAEWTEARMELVSPICTRTALGLDDNFGLNITTQSVFFEQQEISFWDLARLAKAGLEGTGSAEYVTGYLSFFRDIVFGHNDIQQMIDVLKTAFNHHVMVTNLVKVKYNTDFESMKLKALYGPMVRSGKGQEQTIGALTTNGSLCLTNTSDTPIPGLLAEMEKILQDACQTNLSIVSDTGSGRSSSCSLA